MRRYRFGRDTTLDKNIVSIRTKFGQFQRLYYKYCHSFNGVRPLYCSNPVTKWYRVWKTDHDSIIFRNIYMAELLRDVELFIFLSGCYKFLKRWQKDFGNFQWCAEGVYGVSHLNKALVCTWVDFWITHKLKFFLAYWQVVFLKFFS